MALAVSVTGTAKAMDTTVFLLLSLSQNKYIFRFKLIFAKHQHILRHPFFITLFLENGSE